MQIPGLKGIWMTSRKEYRWLPFTFLSYAVCIVVLMLFIPTDDNLKMQLLIFITTAYIGTISNLTARALQRIEERLDQL